MVVVMTPKMRRGYLWVKGCPMHFSRGRDNARIRSASVTLPHIGPMLLTVLESSRG